jgi:hypothetical protein
MLNRMDRGRVARMHEKEKDQIRPMNVSLSFEVHNLKFVLRGVPYLIGKLYKANNQELENEHARRR